jgi:heme-degrading monooxygenase HmoA
MILRRWRGAVRPEDAEAYLAHQGETGVNDYRATAGNLGVVVLRRPVGDLVEVITLSLWESMDEVRQFAGDRPDVAVFYPGDDELLVEKDEHVDHYEVVDTDLDPALFARARTGSGSD